MLRHPPCTCSFETCNTNKKENECPIQQVCNGQRATGRCHPVRTALPTLMPPFLSPRRFLYGTMTYALYSYVYQSVYPRARAEWQPRKYHGHDAICNGRTRRVIPATRHLSHHITSHACPSLQEVYSHNDVHMTHSTVIHTSATDDTMKKL